MQYRMVPKTGEKLSALGFGGMRFPMQKNGRIDKEQTARLLQYAIDNGINYIDTAYMYHNGESEVVIGQALEGGYRENVNLATKLPHWYVRKYEDMEHFLDIQLSRLRTDCIDYYLIHSLKCESWERIRDMGVLDFLDRMKSEGKIRNAGFSFHDSLPVFKDIVDAYDWEFCQIQYNYLDERHQAGTEGLLYAAGRNLAIMVMEPLRGGLLGRPAPGEIGKIWDKLAVKRSPAEWGFRWVLDHSAVCVVLSGMNAKSQLEENIRVAADALPMSLTGKELAVIAKARDAWRSLMRVSCTGCAYCMPCPAGVNIPECFSLYNASFYDREKGKIPPSSSRFMYMVNLGGVMGTPECASLCKNCGKCVKACPQQLPIPKLLEDVRNRMEGRALWLKRPFLRIAIGLMRRYEGKKTR
ncbi:MAG TPA: aldo/keto reductase [Methanoregulaceae archaeon]|nr:aldo/keto reductase [Methanoregulaceae archaeon]